MVAVREEIPRRWRGGTNILYETATEMFTEVAMRSEIVLLPSKYFYPFHYTELQRATENFPNAYAVHYWTKSWGSWE
jgi:hypothetical protein